jgi:hypothetical protein
MRVLLALFVAFVTLPCAAPAETATPAPTASTPVVLPAVLDPAKMGLTRSIYLIHSLH